MVPPPPLPQTTEPKPAKSFGGLGVVLLIALGWAMVMFVILQSPV